MGVLIEQIIEKAVPKSAIFAKIGMILLCLLAAFLMIYTSFGPYAFISLVALIYLTVLVFRNYDAEYEYEYLEGELTVDKIMAKKYRKRMGEFDFKRLAQTSIWPPPIDAAIISIFLPDSPVRFNFTVFGWASPKSMPVIWNSKPSCSAISKLNGTLESSTAIPSKPATTALSVPCPLPVAKKEP